MLNQSDWVRPLDEWRLADIAKVGGKNASLGELMHNLKDEGIRVPDGYATTARAYEHFLDASHLRGAIARELSNLERDGGQLESVGQRIRALIFEAPFPEDLVSCIQEAYRELGKRCGEANVPVAVRSSATAEDLPEASFAGQQESFLNVRGAAELLLACRRCYASLFTDRAITYRIAQGFGHLETALSIGVQRMVRSDVGSSGVAFTLDTETGFPGVVVINSSFGLGEFVVKGVVTPDQFTVFKGVLGDAHLKPIVDRKLGDKARKLVYGSGGTHATVSVDTVENERRSWSLGDADILQIARWAVAIERHYGKPMDVEWAKDGTSGDLYILQARPETVQSQTKAGYLRTCKLKGKGRELVSGLSVGDGIAAGNVSRVLSPKDLGQVRPGSILVTEMTDPDWVPVMRKVAGIVTDFGGRTCHAAIVSRELGIPAVVGTGNATHVLSDGQAVTLSCAEGDRGRIYEGRLPFEVHEARWGEVPKTRTAIMLNLGTPEEAFRWWRLPVRGIGLARMEFIISNHIKIHPMALLQFDRLTDEAARREILERTRGYAERADYFVDRLAGGIAKLAASQHPHPVIVRMSDFKTNEYANLIGGSVFEFNEENPMLGFRGASRYYSPRYRDGFALECRAIRKVRDEMGFRNVKVMIPFCRTLEEADRVIEVMEANGLRRGHDGLELYVMCEIPSNVILAEEFAQRFDGFSIGSNDLTQLIMGVDRDNSELAYLFDERNEAVKRMIRDVISRAHAVGSKVGICGQAPSDYPEFAAFLVECGIDSISLNPDSVLRTIERVAQAETTLSCGGPKAGGGEP
ncbi:MAG: phosphoenolpyruvate synthase [Planctomycetota bacterium]